MFVKKAISTNLTDKENIEVQNLEMNKYSKEWEI